MSTDYLNCKSGQLIDQWLLAIH